jgi:membrane associated rhomboid family serine protease
MIFPLSDDNRDRLSSPVVNIGLIAVNVLVFVLFQGMGTNENFTMAYSCVPAEILSGKDLVTPDQVRVVQTAGGQQRVLVPGLKRTPIPVWLTIFTSIFMHGGLVHLGGNMWFLWIFGDNIEDDMGHGRYIVFYLLSGVIASLAHVFMNASGPGAQMPSLGASGAISGVMGAYLMLHPRRRVTVLLMRLIMDVPGYAAVGLWFAFQIVSSLASLGGQASGVAYAAHIGGFIAGMILARPFLIGRPISAHIEGLFDSR